MGLFSWAISAVLFAEHRALQWVRQTNWEGSERRRLSTPAVCLLPSQGTCLQPALELLVQYKLCSVELTKYRNKFL